MNWNIESDEVIKSRMLGRLPGDIINITGTFSNDLLGPVSMELAEINIDMKHIINTLSVDNKTGKDLDIYAYEITGRIRKKATYATGYVIITGDQGMNINKGTILSNGVNKYLTTEDKVIGEEGSIVVPIQAEIIGSEGNSAKNTINEFSINKPGLKTVINPEALLNGYDEESDESLRQRYYEFIEAPPTSGNDAHYKMWAKEVVGVGEARVVGLWKGPGTVLVVLIDSNKGIPEKDLIDNVYKHIEKVRPIGATLTVQSAGAKEIKVVAKVTLAEKYNIQSVLDNFKDELEKYRQEIAFRDSYVSYAKIGKILLEVDGVLDYEGLLVNGSNKNIGLIDNEIPVFKDIELGVI